jgi:Cu+-exporting ATPase
MAGPSGGSHNATGETRLAIEGMTCAACEGRVTRALEGVPGVRSAKVDLMLRQAVVRGNRNLRPGELIQAVKDAGYSASLDARAPAESGPPLWQVIAAVLLTLPFLLQMAMMALGFRWALDGWLQLALGAPVMLLGAIRFYPGAFGAVIRASGNMDLLVALGSSAAFGLSLWLLSRGGHPHALYFEAASVIIAMVLIGQWLEARARAQATAAIRGLMELQPPTAKRERDGATETVEAASLRPDDVIVIGAGERVAADGVVVGGESELDQSLLTGESVAVAVGPGANVAAGAMNGMGALRVRVTAAGEDTNLGRMIASVSRAQIDKGATGRLVDRISAIFVPIVLVLAAATFAAWWAMGAAWIPALEHAIAVLVIACPCALGLATPAALVAGAGVAAKHGILLRDMSAIEAAAGIGLVAMDKTGTLTQGRPQATDAVAANGDVADVLHLAATAQGGGTHPLALGLIQAAEQAGHPPASVASAQTIPGKGVVAQAGAARLAAGNAALMAQERVDVSAFEAKAQEWRLAGATVVYVARDGEALGAVALKDELKPEAREAVRDLRAAGYRVAILSGDNPEAVARVAAELGVDEAIGGLSPEDKAEYLRRRAAAGERAAFVGDGVNDAPALAAASLGVAVANATGVAGEAAAITVLKPDLRLLPAALDVAKSTRGKIRQNLFWAFVYNVSALPLAALGLLSPAIAGAAMALSSATVVGNASRLSQWTPAGGIPSLLALLLRWALIAGVFIPVGWVLIYAVLPPPGTLLMAGRMIEGDGARYSWRPLEEISPNLVRAVIASEDRGFCDHAGFAWNEIEAAMKQAERTGEPARGASSITNQTAKNAFLWPARSYVRKGVEAYFTVLIEAFWGKRRIMEVYLNIAEWGPGVFGAEEGARYWFKKPAKDLTVREAAALAAILPDPRTYKAAKPGPYIAGRTNTITRRAGGVRASGDANCVLKP